MRINNISKYQNSINLFYPHCFISFLIFEDGIFLFYILSFFQLGWIPILFILSIYNPEFILFCHYLLIFSLKSLSKLNVIIFLLDLFIIIIFYLLFFVTGKWRLIFLWTISCDVDK